LTELSRLPLATNTASKRTLRN